MKVEKNRLFTFEEIDKFNRVKSGASLIGVTHTYRPDHPILTKICEKFEGISDPSEEAFREVFQHSGRDLQAEIDQCTVWHDELWAVIPKSNGYLLLNAYLQFLCYLVVNESEGTDRSLKDQMRKLPGDVKPDLNEFGLKENDNIGYVVLWRLTNSEADWKASYSWKEKSKWHPTDETRAHGRYVARMNFRDDDDEYYLRHVKKVKAKAPLDELAIRKAEHYLGGGGWKDFKKDDPNPNLV